MRIRKTGVFHWVFLPFLLLSALVCICAIGLLKCCPTANKDNDQVLDLLSQQTAFQVLRGTIGNRKEFANAASQGLGVTETKKDKKAYNEIQNLYQFIFGE